MKPNRSELFTKSMVSNVALQSPYHSLNILFSQSFLIAISSINSKHAYEVPENSWQKK